MYRSGRPAVRDITLGIDFHIRTFAEHQHSPNHTTAVIRCSCRPFMGSGTKCTAVHDASIDCHPFYCLSVYIMVARNRFYSVLLSMLPTWQYSQVLRQEFPMASKTTRYDPSNKKSIILLISLTRNATTMEAIKVSNSSGYLVQFLSQLV